MKIKIVIRNGVVTMDNDASGKKCDVSKELAKLVGSKVEADLKLQYYDEAEVVMTEVGEG